MHALLSCSLSLSLFYCLNITPGYRLIVGHIIIKRSGTNCRISSGSCPVQYESATTTSRMMRRRTAVATFVNSAYTGFSELLSPTFFKNHFLSFSCLLSCCVLGRLGGFLCRSAEDRVHAFCSLSCRCRVLAFFHCLHTF